jgi:hypothetical protein
LWSLCALLWAGAADAAGAVESATAAVSGRTIPIAKDFNFIDFLRFICAPPFGAFVTSDCKPKAVIRMVTNCSPAKGVLCKKYVLQRISGVSRVRAEWKLRA